MKRKSYTLSSSDEESTKKAEKTSLLTNQTNVDDNEQFKEILKSNKVQKLKFKCMKSCNTLFYHEIDAEDEVYLVQCPKNTDLTTLREAKVKFDAVVSNIRCHVNESRERLTVYSVDDFPSQVNLALPKLATKSFQIKALPVAGRLVMQKSIRIREMKTEVKTENSDFVPKPPKAEANIDEIKSESFTPEKKPLKKHG